MQRIQGSLGLNLIFSVQWSLTRMRHLCMRTAHGMS